MVSPARAACPALAPSAGDVWREYWGHDELWRDCRLWEASAALLLRRAAGLVPFGPADTVLDVGCGPGHLAALLAPQVAAVHAVDVAPQLLAACQARCRPHGNVTTALLGEDATDLRPLGGPFTRILCVSVVQYYRDPADVTRLIASAREIAAAGALMLVADLPLARGMAGFAWDALCTVARAAREGYLAELLGAARRRWAAAGAGYAATERRAAPLTFTRAGAAGLAAGLGVRATLVRRSLTAYANRPSLLVEFRR